MAWECNICGNFRSKDHLCDLIQHVLNDHYNLEYRFGTGNQIRHEKTTIFSHTCGNGSTFKMCTQCQMCVDENGNPDQDRYTARQYFKIMETPVEKRCQHRVRKAD